MTTNRPGTTSRLIAPLVLILIGTLLATACGGSPLPSAAPAPTVVRGAVVATPAGNKTTAKLDCPALSQALLDLIGANSGLLLLTNSNGAVTNQLDSSFYIDTAKMRADLDLLAALPDPTDAAEVALMGKPTEAIPQYRQLLDLVDSIAKAGGTPGATTGTDDGQKFAAYTAKLIKMYTGIANALGDACPDQPTPAAQADQIAPQATALTARYQIGQAAPVGNLRVTLDKIVTVAGADPLQPLPNSRLVIAYFTVENNGTVPFGVNTLINTRFEDASAKQYRPDPFVAGLDPQTTNFEGKIAAGEKRSGATISQVPAVGSDLLWLFEDARPNIAVFAVKASDIGAAGTPVTELTADALRLGAAATGTAFVEMALSADATQAAAGTDTPAPEEPTETLAPPEPTDIPASLEPGDTPTANP